MSIAFDGLAVGLKVYSVADYLDWEWKQNKCEHVYGTWSRSFHMDREKDPIRYIH